MVAILFVSSLNLLITYEKLFNTGDKMCRRIISIVLLFALIHYSIMGCSRATREVKILNTEIDATVDEKIVAVVLPTGEVIRFDSRGGRFDWIPQGIDGIDEKGDRIFIALDDADEIRVTRPMCVKSLDEIQPEKITEIITKHNSIIRFEPNSCKFIEPKGIIECRIEGGREFKFNINAVKEIRISQPDAISREELINNPNTAVYEVITDHMFVTFDDNGGRLRESGYEITGWTRELHQVFYNIDDILYIRVERRDAAKTFFAAIGALALTAAIIFAIIALTKESCPFVYTFDGEKYVFDAEPLGGAIAKGLEKADFSRLEHLNAVDNKFLLMFRNEVEEIQYLDELKLWIIDHAPDSEIFPDINGKLYAVKNVIKSSRAVDEKDLNLQPFLNERDDISWQTYLPRDNSYKEKPLRHRLTLEFAKPQEAEHAMLLVNAGTALWGSNMIREMLQLRGDKIDQWYEGVNNQGKEFLELYHFIDREELYLLKIQVKKGNTWIEQGFIPGGGPLITEDRIIPLDLSGINDSLVTIRLDPPTGFWTIDFIGIAYQAKEINEIEEISGINAVDQDGRNVTGMLHLQDGQYHIMPRLGDWLKVEFAVTPEVAGYKRSIFMKTIGYYEIQIDKSQPEKTDLIKTLLTTPGKIVDYSMEEYLKWREKQLSLQ